MIAENLQKVKATLKPDVRLVAVSKFHPLTDLQEAYDAGQRVFGESHVQELVAKQEALPKDIEWHFIGHLQTNKVNTLPRAVQEASLLYSNLEKDDSQLPYDNSIRQSYEAFNKFVQNHPIRSMKESDYIYSQKFGKTFFYYYYFVRNLQTY